MVKVKYKHRLNRDWDSDFFLSFFLEDIDVFYLCGLMISSLDGFSNAFLFAFDERN